MYDRNGADWFVICQYYTISIQNFASGGFYFSFSLLQIFCLRLIIFSLKKHKIDQTPAQNHRHQNNRKEYDTYFSAVIGFIPLHEKHHKPFLKAYALQSLSKNSLSLVLLFLFISGLGSVMLSGILWAVFWPGNIIALVYTGLLFIRINIHIRKNFF